MIYGHSDDGFLTIWSTTKGHEIVDLSLFSESIKNTFKSNFEKSCLYDMLVKVRKDIRWKPLGEHYCVQFEDTSYHKIGFAKRPTSIT